MQKSLPYLWPKRRQNSQNRYPIYDQNGWKTLPFGAAHTYIAHIREYPPRARRYVVLGARAWQPAWHKWMFKATLRSTDRKSVISTLQKYNFWSLASHKIITNGIYKKDSGLQCPLTTYQKMQLCLTLSKNTDNRRNLAYVFDYQRGCFKNTINWQINNICNYTVTISIVSL